MFIPIVMLETHLRYNHYPPLPVQLAPACVAAVDALRDDDSECMIELTDLTLNGKSVVTAATLADACNLWGMV